MLKKSARSFVLHRVLLVEATTAWTSQQHTLMQSRDVLHSIENQKAAGQNQFAYKLRPIYHRPIYL